MQSSWSIAAVGACLLALGGLAVLTAPRNEALYAPPTAASGFSTILQAGHLPSRNQWMEQTSLAQPVVSKVRHAPQHAIAQTEAAIASESASTSSFLVMGAAMVFGSIFGYYFKFPKAGPLQEEIAMAAYQAEFAAGGRHSSRLYAATDFAELKKKLDALKKEAADKMEGAVEATGNKFASVRTGRANPALLDRIRVEYYGTLTPLKQVAGISIPDASTIVISPFDRSSIGAIEKAIGGSDLGMTPSNDGERIRIKVPPLTEDRRKEMVKTVAKMGEEGKVSIRNVRRDVLKSADKLELSENAEAEFKDDIQKLTDKYVKKLEEVIQAKEKDLTTV